MQMRTIISRPASMGLLCHKMWNPGVVGSSPTLGECQFTFFLLLQFQTKSDKCNRPLHDGRGMMGNQGKNYSEWVSKMRFFDNFSRIFQFQTLDFSWSNSKNIF